MDRNTTVWDIECVYCTTRIGVTIDFINLAWCNYDCYINWLKARGEE